MRFLLGALVGISGFLIAYGALTGFLPEMLAAFLAPSALVQK